ncbi:GNAT family N-acetyltransferase [Leptolyngbya sp. 7M]|uniref:GNAT family N-acetyltransferase n=1 Tax=Leptolyngbya sp. 7M TaxID=2812896 RepID=UPI001B8AAACE|nr:GNAT family N-acetyltransferase [Leptolyngbya sp. 7M]QYO65660.1 GNAT family N-acetyltransferase [Leptolyngbya sp. 7M]
MPPIEQRASELFRDTEFAEEVSQECLSIEFLIQQFDAGRLWVAVDGGDVPVGFAAALVIDGNAHLHEVSVDPIHGRRGIGRKLIEAVYDWAVSHAFEGITLSTFRDIPWNAPLYQKLGFIELPETEHGPEMKLLRNEERESGLDISQRIIMIRVI